MVTSKSILNKKFFGSSLLVLFLLSFSLNVLYAQTGWRKADDLFEEMQLNEGSWVADIGTREGYYATRMSPIVGESGHVFAVDVNENSLEDLHSSIREQNLKNITPVFSIYESPLLPSNSLDAALVRNAYHEFTDYMEMLAEIKRALKSGGLLVMSEADVVGGSGPEVPRDDLVDDHDMSLFYAKKELKEAGYKIIKEVKEFSEVRRRNQYWLLVATPEK